MQIEKVDISSLLPDPNNARKHDKKNLDSIKGSLAKFGQQKPIVVNHQNIVVAGNGTLEAAKQMGWSQIDIVRTDLEGFNAAAYALADNRTSELAAWDDGVLGAQLLALQTDGFDLSDIGFDAGDWDEPKSETEGLTDPDDVPDVDENPYNVQTGDIWQLGKHRLMCGDSTKAEDVERLMDGNRADISFTSPPYNVGSLEIEGNEETKNKYNTYDDNKTEDQYEEFLLKNLACLLNSSDEVFYNIGIVENNKRPIINVQYKLRDKFKDIIYWKKSTAAPHIQPGIINNLVEFILCFGDGKRKFKNAQFSQGTYWNVIEGSNASKNEFSKIHKATFPIYLPDNVIDNFCPKKGRVIDSFCGTGTTLISCEKTNRICYGMEIDQHYCSVIIKRWEDFTGKKAQKL